MNYWKQLNHVMKYFRGEEDPKAHLPKNFISGFLEVRCIGSESTASMKTDKEVGSQLDQNDIFHPETPSL